MHRATPLNSSFRAYSAGGSRAVIHEVSDGPQMQETKANFMRNETRENIECPQNYGFTSVCADGDKDDKGNLTMGPEAFIGFNGGNRSFPVAYVMDDRRHRLKELEKGDSAMFRGRKDRQQFHFSKDGNFMSCRDDRIQRIALVPKPDDDQQQQQQSGTSGGGGKGDQKGKQDKAEGQKSALDDNKKSQVYMEQKGDVQTQRHGDAHSAQRPSDSSTYMSDRKKSTQVTEKHSHLRTGDFRIFTDEMGCWSEIPMLVKKDSYCKE